MLNLEDLTDYKIVYIGIFGDPRNGCKLLKILVGERGFEPPTPWSRTVQVKTLSALSGVAQGQKDHSISPFIRTEVVPRFNRR